MEFTLKNGKKIKAASVVGIVPARLRYVDAKGALREVKENDLQQIDPPLTKPLKELDK